jgi:hypothetical protein
LRADTGGLTGIVPYGGSGTEFLYSGVGPAAMIRNPDGWVGFGTEGTNTEKLVPGYSAAITIKGLKIPEPNAFSFLLLTALIIGLSTRKTTRLN